MPSRNERCPCGSGSKYKRCCLERLDAVARELRARDELLGDVIAWLKDQHGQTLQDASSETTLIRMLRGAIGRNMSLVWALNDYRPADGGPPLLARYVDRPELGPSARAIARGLAEARLTVYQVRSLAPGVWLELEPLAGGRPARVAWRDGLDRLEVGELLVMRIVHATSMPTVWGLGVRFPADTSRRWKARLASLPADTARAALIVLGFHPDDAAEPIPEGVELHTVTWSIDDDEAVLDALECEDLWESLGEAIPRGWALAWPDEATCGSADLGGWREHPGEIEIARLIVDEREASLISGDRAALAEISTHVQTSLRGLIAAHPQARAA